jgi:Holliday junction resolvase RusA-like endonuclease
MINFFVAGTPRPKQSVKACVRKSKGGKAYPQMYQPRNSLAAQWMQRVRIAANQNKPPEPLDVPLGIAAFFQFKRPQKSKFNRPAVKVYGDFDNLLKPVLDSMAGVIFTDDALICSAAIKKEFAEEEGLLIKIWTLGEETR